MTKEREAELVRAHQVGRRYAASLLLASRTYDDAELQEVFLAAIVGELHRAGVKLPVRKVENSG